MGSHGRPIAINGQGGNGRRKKSKGGRKEWLDGDGGSSSLLSVLLSVLLRRSMQFAIQNTNGEQRASLPSRHSTWTVFTSTRRGAGLEKCAVRFVERAITIALNAIPK